MPKKKGILVKEPTTSFTTKNPHRLHTHAWWDWEDAHGCGEDRDFDGSKSSTCCGVMELSGYNFQANQLRDFEQQTIKGSRNYEGPAGCVVHYNVVGTKELAQLKKQGYVSFVKFHNPNTGNDVEGVMKYLPIERKPRKGKRTTS